MLLIYQSSATGPCSRTYMAGIVPVTLLHFLQPWRSDVFTSSGNQYPVCFIINTLNKYQIDIHIKQLP